MPGVQRPVISYTGSAAAGVVVAAQVSKANNNAVAMLNQRRQRTACDRGVLSKASAVLGAMASPLRGDIVAAAFDVS